MKGWEIAVISVITILVVIAISIQIGFLVEQMPPPLPTQTSNFTLKFVPGPAPASVVQNHSINPYINTRKVFIPSCTDTLSYPYNEQITINTSNNNTVYLYPFSMRNLIGLTNKLPYYLTNVYYPLDTTYENWVFYDPTIYTESDQQPYGPILEWTLSNDGVLSTNNGYYYLPTKIDKINNIVLDEYVLYPYTASEFAQIVTENIANSQSIVCIYDTRNIYFLTKDLSGNAVLLKLSIEININTEMKTYLREFPNSCYIPILHETTDYSSIGNCTDPLTIITNTSNVKKVTIQYNPLCSTEPECNLDLSFTIYSSNGVELSTQESGNYTITDRSITYEFIDYVIASYIMVTSNNTGTSNEATLLVFNNYNEVIQKSTLNNTEEQRINLSFYQIYSQ